MKDYFLRKGFFFLNKVGNFYPEKAKLETKHVRNCKLVSDKFDILQNMPKNSVCAEVGVAHGKFTEQILSIMSPKKIHLVDLWGKRNYSERHYNGSAFHTVSTKFKKEIESKEVEINRGFSHDELIKFNDDYFDWVYIDTDHSYSTTVKELEAVRTKMKSNGIISGHDYVQGEWNSGIRYGVVEAVNEFCLKYNFEFIYLSMETHMHHSFAIRKITE